MAAQTIEELVKSCHRPVIPGEIAGTEIHCGVYQCRRVIGHTLGGDKSLWFCQRCKVFSRISIEANAVNG